MKFELTNQKGGLLTSLVTLIFLGLLVAISAYIYPDYSLGAFSNLLIVEDEPEKADAIVVLLGGQTPARVIKAVELLESAYSDLILFGSGYREKKIESEHAANVSWLNSADNYLIALKSLSIAPRNIRVIDSKNAHDSSSELKQIANYARVQGWSKVILVSSLSHTRRIDLIWNRIASDIRHLVIPAEQPGFRQWWQNGRNTKSLFYEYGALVKEGFRQLKSFL